jgi:two-component system sensor histidine kinase RpfC
LKILVCEDESTNQKIITRLLSLPGHQVDIVSNSDEMLDTLERNKFDLVITDLNMSGMNGADALKLYRFTQPTDRDTRFILFTADATLSAREMASDAGFDAFLTKPIDAATLFNTIERILNLAPNTATQWMNNALNIPVNINLTLEPNTASLDLTTLKELEKIGAGDDLFMHRLLRNYLTDSTKQIAKIETAVKQKQYGAVQDYCHALKGNSLSVGAIQLATTVEAFGKLSASTHASHAIEMLDILNKDFSQLAVAVEGYLKSPEAALNK